MNRSSLTSQMTRRNWLAATQLSRRNWLAATTGTVLGSSLGGWLRAGRRGHDLRQPQAILYSALDERRAEPDRYLRSKAGPCTRRSVQSHRDAGAGRLDLGTSAADRDLDEPVGHRPIDVDARGRPRPGEIEPAHRLLPSRVDPVSRSRVAGVEGIREDHRRFTKLCEHSARRKNRPGTIARRISGSRLFAALDRRRSRRNRRGRNL